MISSEDIINCALHYEFFCEKFFEQTMLDGDARGQQNYMGKERELVSLLCWKLLFHANETFLVVCPNGQLASYWCQMVENAVRQLPKEVAFHARFNRQREIATNNQTRMLFEVMSRNTGRGMTAGGVYLVESQLVNRGTYKQFWDSAAPVFHATNAQVVHYTRGY